jgi:hypothetical protein
MRNGSTQHSALSKSFWLIELAAENLLLSSIWEHSICRTQHSALGTQPGRSLR